MKINWNLFNSNFKYACTCRKQWSSKILHRKSWQGELVTSVAYVLQSIGFTSLQKLRPVGRKINFCYRRNRILRAGMTWKKLNFLWKCIQIFVNVPFWKYNFPYEILLRLLSQFWIFSNSSYFLFLSLLKCSEINWFSWITSILSLTKF